MSDRVNARVSSRRLGNINEIAVLAPIRLGRVPGERRTFEERLRNVIRSIQTRAELGVPTLLNQVQTIHFGRLIILRPEQYLHYSTICGIDYVKEPQVKGTSDDAPSDQSDGKGLVGDSNGTDDATANPKTAPNTQEKVLGGIPQPLDDFHEEPLGAPAEAPKVDPGKSPECKCAPPILRSHLLTLVTFDGDLKVYFRDIADILGDQFDRVFENCENFNGTSNFEDFWSWIRRYQISVDLFHAAYPDLSVVEIKRLQYFKRRFDDFVARVRRPGGQPNPDINELFDEFLSDTQQFAEGFPSIGGVFDTSTE